MTIRLDRLQRDVSITEGNGRPTLQFQAAEQRKIEQIEAAFQSLEEQIALIAAAQAAADAADAAAIAANAAAVIAQDAADDALLAADGAASVGQITSSGVAGLTMTATDAGADVTITISAHTRIYGDGTTVSVSGGSLTGRSYSTDYYIYYDDVARAGGAVSYQSTTTAATAAQTGDRHSLGAVSTPAAAGAPILGKYNLGPGLVDL